ncbi:hypothetical protein BJ138DRAFT_169026 [Hygrophoropsis aurantiaca]|uniref:Uncharacterized protein n=1 Tax=Hygrophoropsis aurantiaca TaxID=72124 RepID=A0ACB8A9H2_9AGAM|nr:hypothetical protein BJ138DRAFT_169026 [Hygrophoropsis aurantiaca]
MANISRISFQDLIEKARSGSVEHLDILSFKCVQFPAHIGVILPIFYAHLNPALIPKQISPETRRDIVLAKWSLLGIMTYLSALDGESAEQVFQHATKNWTRLYPWILFFYHSFLSDLPIARTRLNSPVSIWDATTVTAGFLATLYDNYPTARSLILNTPALHTTIMGIWNTIADLQDYDVDVQHPDYHAARSIVFFRESIGKLVAYCLGHNEPVPCFPIFVTAAGGISVIVNTTLKRLRHLGKEVKDLKEPASKAETLQMHKFWSSYATDFVQITQILLSVSTRGGVAAHEELISKGSVHAMASTMAQLRTKLLGELPDDRTDPRAGLTLWSLYCGCQYIRYAMLESESDDSTPILCEALEARILETILQAGHIESEYTPYHRRDQDFDVMLLSELPSLLMHSEVLRVSAKSLSRIRLQDIERHAHHDRILLNAWDNFKEAVARFSQIENKLRSIKKPKYEFTCGGDQECQCISRNETKPELYRCSGCLIVKYCSRRCQRTDWKRRHRAQCRIIRLAIGASGSHDIRRNLLVIAAIETEERIPGGAPLKSFLDDARRANPDYRGEVVAVLDMTAYPFLHSVQPISRYSDIIIKDRRYEDVFQIIRSASSNIFEIVKLRQGNTVHYLLSPSTVLKAIFDWPPAGVTFPTFGSLSLRGSTTPKNNSSTQGL